MPKKPAKHEKLPGAVQRRANLGQRNHVSSLKSFKHQALERPDHQIRLLRFLRDDQLGLVFELETYTVQEPPPYAAISYAWGEPGRTQNIIINDERLQVGQNAHYALWQATVASRGKSFEHYWIDSICIDQSNLREKSHQVGMMGRIYSGAALVYACVGQHSGTSRTVAQNMNEKDIGPDIMKAMTDLGQRPYWSRAWIIQELALADKFQILCGDVTVSTKTLYVCLNSNRSRSELAPLWGQLLVTPMEAVLSRIRPSEDGLTGSVDLTSTRFIDFVMRYHTWECADRRDRIYAFASFGDAEPIVPDYNISPAKLAMDTLNYLNQHGGLDSHGIERVSESLVQALQLDVASCQSLRDRLSRKRSRPHSSLSEFRQPISLDVDSANQVQSICWTGASFASLQIPSHSAEPALEIHSSAASVDTYSPMESVLDTTTAHQEVQKGSLKRITANNRLLGFVNANVAPGDLLVDLRDPSSQWPLIVVRPDQDGIYRAICSAWLIYEVRFFPPSAANPIVSRNNVTAIHNTAGSAVHGECSVNFSPEDLLVLAATVIRGGILRPETIADLAKEYDRMNACAELHTVMICDS